MANEVCVRSCPRVCKVSFNTGGVPIVAVAIALLPFTIPSPVTIPSPARSRQVYRYEYVFPDSSIDVYDMGKGGALVKRVTVPAFSGVRGRVASAVTGMLYISYGSDHGTGGSMLKYNLRTDQVVSAKQYPFGIDSMSISPDGNTIYMPTAELASGGIWKVIDAKSGNVRGSIDSEGTGPHHSVVSSDGARVYPGAPPGCRPGPHKRTFPPPF